MLSDPLLDKCQKLLYRAWADAFDNLKAVRMEKNDGSPDWEQFHASRLKFATEEETHLKELLTELNAVAPLTRKA